MYSALRTNVSLSIMRISEKPFCQTGARNPSSRPRPERKAALDKLYRPLNRQVATDREQSVEVIGHHNKFVEPEFSLGAILVQYTHEQSSGTVGLKKVPLAGDRRGYEERPGSGSNGRWIGTTKWNGHDSG